MFFALNKIKLACPTLVLCVSVAFLAGCSRPLGEEEADALFKSAYADYIRTSLNSLASIEPDGDDSLGVESRISALRSVAKTHSLHSCSLIELDAPYADVKAAVCELRYTDSSGVNQVRSARYVVSPSGQWTFAGVAGQANK